MQANSPLDALAELLTQLSDAEGAVERARVASHASRVLRQVSPAERRVLAHAVSLQGVPLAERWVRRHAGSAVTADDISELTRSVMAIDRAGASRVAAELRDPARLPALLSSAAEVYGLPGLASAGPGQASTPSGLPPPSGRPVTAAPPPREPQRPAAAAAPAEPEPQWVPTSSRRGAVVTPTPAPAAAAPAQTREPTAAAPTAAAAAAAAAAASQRREPEPAPEDTWRPEPAVDVELPSIPRPVSTYEPSYGPSFGASQRRGSSPASSSPAPSVSSQSSSGTVSLEDAERLVSSAVDSLSSTPLGSVAAPRPHAPSVEPASLAASLVAAPNGLERLRRLRDTETDSLGLDDVIATVWAAPEGWQRRMLLRRLLRAEQHLDAASTAQLLGAFPGRSERFAAAAHLLRLGVADASMLVDHLDARDVPRLQVRARRTAAR